MVTPMATTDPERIIPYTTVYFPDSFSLDLLESFASYASLDIAVNNELGQILLRRKPVLTPRQAFDKAVEEWLALGKTEAEAVQMAANRFSTPTTPT